MSILGIILNATRTSAGASAEASTERTTPDRAGLFTGFSDRGRENYFFRVRLGSIGFGSGKRDMGFVNFG